MNTSTLYLKKHEMKIIISISVLVFILLFSIFSLSPIIRPFAEKQLTGVLDREVRIGKIHFNPLF